MPRKQDVEVRLLNLCKRLIMLSKLQQSHNIVAVAEEIEIGVKELLQGKT